MGSHRDFLVDCLHMTQLPFCVRWTEELYEVHYLCGFDMSGGRVVSQAPCFYEYYGAAVFRKGAIYEGFCLLVHMM